MKTKIVVIALIAVTAGVFAYTRPHNAMPSDLRDAVADNGEFNTSIPVFEKDSGNIPAPKAAPVEGYAKDYVAGVGSPSTELIEEWIGTERLGALEGTTYFDKLRSLFEQGAPAKEEDFRFSLAGRIIGNDDKNALQGTLLVFRSADEGGPALGVMSYKAAFLQSPEVGNYDEHFCRAWLEDALTVSLKFPGAKGEFSYNSSSKNVVGKRGKGLVEIRKAQGGIVTHMVKHDGDGKITMEYFAYYFKKTVEGSVDDVCWGGYPL